MKRQTKGKKRVKASKKAFRKKGTSLKASAAKGKASHSGKEWTPDMAGYFKPLKKPITLRLDADVLAWYKGDGRGYQTRINQALRKIMMDQRKRK